MSKRTIWRLALTILTCLACSYFFLPLEKIRLGLDLAGGVEFTMEVQGHEALANDFTDTRDKLFDRLNEKSISASARLEDDALTVTFPLEQKPEVEKILKEFHGYQVSFSDTGARLTQTPAYQAELKTDANKRALQIIENRVNATGVAEPEIKQAGEEGNRIIVELPGLAESEIDRIKALLQTPGKLEKRLAATQNLRGDRDHGGWSTREKALEHFHGQLPEGTELLPEVESDRDLRQRGETPPKLQKGEQRREVVKAWHLVELKSYVDGADVTRAVAAVDPTLGRHVINFSLNSKGSNDFFQLSKIAAQDGRLIAVLLDKKVVSMLSCERPIPGGSVQVSGSFTKEEAEDFALKLKSGSMRASMKYLEERSMGASLGADSIRAGARSSIIGFFFVVAFMLFYYRWSGVNAIVALTVNVIIMLGLMGSFNAVITLPGVAGFALTLGMAVDANILIYERIREELAQGKSVPGAIQSGYDRAFWTIVDSHVTQLVSALLLFIFGTGPVKGFAVALSVGVTASLFTSIYITRWIYDWILERNPNTKTLSLGVYNLLKGSSFNFTKYKSVTLNFMWCAIVFCLVAAQPWKGIQESRVKLGMQFVGGLDMVVRYRGDVRADDIRGQLTEGGFADASVVNYKGTDRFRDYSVKVPARRGQDEKDAVKIKEDVTEALRKVDPEFNKDPRPDLNSKETKEILDDLVANNPLALGGGEEGLQPAYAEYMIRFAEAKHEGQGFIDNLDNVRDLPQGLKEYVAGKYRLGNLSVQSSQSFSPSVAGEWTAKTLTAAFWSLGAILVYIMFRFTLSFSISCIIGLILDTLLSLGIFTLFGFEYSVPVVASFLILIGYSTSDTIVVFDRIRENMRRPEYRRVSIEKLVNDSINQTLSRTILTSLTTLFVAACLFFFGGPALHDLSFPLVMGIIIGTLSTIYISSPILIYLDKLIGGRDRIKQHA